MPLTLKEVIGKIKQATVPGLERSRLQVLAAEKQILWQYLSDDDDVVQDLKVALAGPDLVTEKEILADPLPPLEYTSSRKSTRGRAHVRPEAVIVGDLSGLSAAAIALQEGADNRELVYQRLPKKFEVQMESEGGIGGIIQQAILPPLNQRAKRATETGFSWVQLPSLVDWRPDGAGGSAPLAGLAGAAGGPAGVPAAATGREEKREAEGPSTEACPQALQEPPGTDASGAAALTEMDRKGKGKVDESEGKRALDPPEVIESAETDKRRLRKRDQEGKVSIESKSNPMVPPLDSKQALKKKKTDFLLRKLKKVENPETLNLDELQELEEVEEVGDAPSEERDSSALMPEEGGGPVASGRGPLGEHGGEGSAEGAEGAGPSTSEVKPSNAAPKAPKITYFYRDGRLVMELKYRGVPKKLADAFNRGDPAAIDLVGQGYGYAAYLDLDFFVITDYEVWFVCRIINGFPELVEIAGPFLRTDVRPTVMALLFVVQDRVLEEREERPSWREQLQGKHILREHFEALEQRLEQEKEDAEAAALGQETESEMETPEPKKKKPKQKKSGKGATGTCKEENFRDDEPRDDGEDGGGRGKDAGDVQKRQGDALQKNRKGGRGGGQGRTKGETVSTKKKGVCGNVYGIPSVAERKAEVIPVLELNLGRELGRGMSGSVREGLWQGQRVAIKMSSLAGGYGDVPILQREVAVYGVLASLQGDVIPVLVSWGWTWEGAAFFLATSLIEGASLNAVSGSAASLTKLQLGAEARLRRIHALGVAHGDISMENLVVERSPKGEFRVVFLDLGMAHAPASAAEKSADTRALKEVFRSVRQDLLGKPPTDTVARPVASSSAGRGRLPARFSQMPADPKAVKTGPSVTSGEARLRIIGES